ncbi:MAG TPA: hypothetical protein VNO32_12980, partial [Candidatus Acidoferrum sp.]|nr:hypothetical protein [Candidatus Acidoferrum sp.]
MLLSALSAFCNVPLDDYGLHIPLLPEQLLPPPPPSACATVGTAIVLRNIKTVAMMSRVCFMLVFSLN